jgi:hypothetical protein
MFRHMMIVTLFTLTMTSLFESAHAEETADTVADNADNKPVVFGVKVSAGGRYDDVRMCVATPPGKKGGPAMDISAFAEISLKKNVSLFLNLPVMRPLLFAAAFKMLQFEPEAALLFRKVSDGRADLVGGPTLGIIFHYGPDYRSDSKGDERLDSFFAMGPKVGGYLGVDFKRPGKKMNFQLGFSPYVSPLFGISDPDDHRGVVVGGSVDALFRFSTP